MEKTVRDYYSKSVVREHFNHCLYPISRSTSTLSIPNYITRVDHISVDFLDVRMPPIIYVGLHKSFTFILS